MTDCMDARMRDQLPDYLHGRLDGRERASVAAHLAGCDDCRAELALLAQARQALDRAPAIDVAGITARVIAAARPADRAADRPAMPRLVPPARRPRPGRRWTTRSYARAAAAMLLVAALASLPALVQQWGREPASGGGDTLVALLPVPGADAQRVATATVPGTAVPAAARPEITFGGGLADLSEGELAELISDLEALEALPDAEPAPGLAVEPLGDA